MFKSIFTPLLALVVISGMLGVRSAEAEESLGIIPGSICQPIDDQSASVFLRNSGGTIANLSGEDLPPVTALVQCPIRLPFSVFPGETLEWSAYFLSNNTGVCWLRIAAHDGELLGTISGYPVAIDGPAPGQSFWSIQLSAPIGSYGVNALVASARCELPPISSVNGVAGLTSYRARLF